MTDHEAYAAGLRDLADWIERNQGIPLPQNDLTNFAVDTKEDAEAIVRSGGSCKKVYSDDHFYINKNFGPLEVRHFFYRKNVCTARVIGEKEIPETFIPGYVQPARKVPIIEWDCNPILAATPEEAAND